MLEGPGSGGEVSKRMGPEEGEGGRIGGRWKEEIGEIGGSGREARMVGRESYGHPRGLCVLAHLFGRAHKG